MKTPKRDTFFADAARRRLSVELGADWYGLAFGLRLSCWAVRVDFLVFNFEVSLVSEDES